MTAPWDEPGSAPEGTSGLPRRVPHSPFPPAAAPQVAQPADASFSSPDQAPPQPAPVAPAGPAQPPVTQPGQAQPSVVAPGQAPPAGIPTQPSFTPAFSPPSGPPASGPPASAPPRPRVSNPAAAPIPGPAAPPRTPRSGPSHRKPTRRSRISRRERMVAVLVVMAGVITIGLMTGFGTEQSAEPTVEQFLLDWQQQHYAAAAALTTGNSTTVAAALRSDLTDLDATAMFLSMGSVTQHGSTADASFNATVDLAEGGHQWTYRGHFTLQSLNDGWKIRWAPSLVEPDLGSGDRLAVQTSYSPRGEVLDSEGQSLLEPAAAYVIGVTPGTLSNATQTATEFANLTGLDEGQVLGEIHAAPPREFLGLLTLDQSDYGELADRLRGIPGLSEHQESSRLFNSVSSDVVGQVGTEDSPALRAQGTAYQPGETIGESGIEQADQPALEGTPTTDVVVVNAAGSVVKKVTSWTGTAGTSVHTTINGADQRAAMAALNSQPSQSGEIVAVQASTGDILAVADQGQAMPQGGALDARVQPGMTFSIVSAAALLDDSFSADKQVPCDRSTDVGGQTFTTDGGSGATEPFAAVFADGCGTAFANLSTLLTSTQLSAAEKSFGIGAQWELPIQAFSGTSDAHADNAGLAADTIGAGGVRVSPLGMALVAAEVDSGTGHDPAIIASDPPAAWRAPLSTGTLSELRGLMRTAVTSGAGRAANVSGAPVYGQTGLTQTGAHTWLSWFVGYRGDTAFSVLETSSTAQQAAASLTAAFLNSLG
jgi:cell division protein FtsI/penicillin-binding protein 2